MKLCTQKQVHYILICETFLILRYRGEGLGDKEEFVFIWEKVLPESEHLPAERAVKCWVI